MIFGIHQPYFLPYIGYFQLINAVDLYALADNYKYIKNGWINRNRILCNGAPCYLTIEVHHPSQNRLISEHMIAERADFALKLVQVRDFYRKAPHLEEGMSLLEEIFNCDERNLSAFLARSIRLTCDYLGITTKIISSAEIAQDPSLKREERLYDYCRKLNADQYLNAIGGMEIYHFDEFKAHGIELGFLSSIPVPYDQGLPEFVENLSILDAIMFNDKENLQKMLDSYRIIRE